VEVAGQRLERARQQEEFAENRYELGTATTSDLLRARIEVANAELAALEARSGLRTASLELGRVVGLAEEVSPADRTLPDRPPALPLLAELVERGVRSSPAVQAAEASGVSRRLTGRAPEALDSRPAAGPQAAPEPAAAMAREVIHSS
jgi:outer membrane protein